ncbi:MAG TPA: hypothetical protein DHW71_08350 [Gammaproteobacteria bacterium]|nr:hypothetical protein [Gammaproteobacteria bacterium]HBF06820.1 hypothetical protein [Gammaproteobacteria bacterium]HCK92983.1 hypothetical protein [Gammaproteobacteria bacterium]|tara:strand:- start:357 stop:776 length:420 start_codon:yes stop_codon:yes gene_type:complete
MREDKRFVIFTFIVYPLVLMFTAGGVFYGQLIISIPFLYDTGDSLIVRDLLLYTIPFIIQTLVVVLFIQERAPVRKTFFKVLSLGAIYLFNYISIGVPSTFPSRLSSIVQVLQIVIPIVNMFIALMLVKFISRFGLKLG